MWLPQVQEITAAVAAVEESPAQTVPQELQGRAATQLRYLALAVVAEAERLGIPMNQSLALAAQALTDSLLFSMWGKR